jgi:hypothetical protein
MVITAAVFRDVALALCLWQGHARAELSELPRPTKYGVAAVTGLRLNADLVVLSACRTGQGAVFRSDGVSGLAGALLLAGCRRWCAASGGSMTRRRRSCWGSMAGCSATYWRPKRWGRCNGR